MSARPATGLALLLALAAPGLRAQAPAELERLVDADYRLNDVIHLEGMTEPVVGTITAGREEGAKEITIKKAGSGLTFSEKRERVKRIEDRQTPASAFQERAGLLAALSPARADLHRRLAEWGLKHSLQLEAEEQLERAVKADADPARAAGHRERLVDLLEARLGESAAADGPAADDLLERIAAHADQAASAGVDSPRLRLASARVSVRLGLIEAAVAELEQARATLAARAAGPPPQDDPEPQAPPPGGATPGGAPGGGKTPPGPPRFNRDGEALAPGKGGAPAQGGGKPAPPAAPKGKPATDKSPEVLAGLRRVERPLLAQVSDLLGELLLQLGRPEPAAAAFRQVLEAWPEEARASLGLARALAAAGDRAGGIAQLGLALEVAPGDPELLLLRGQLHYLEGADDLARVDLESGVRYVPDREAPLARELLVALGLVHLVQGRFAEAAPLFGEADAPPGWGPARLGLGLLSEWQGELEQARTHYDVAARLLSPAGGEASYLLGWALLGAGKAEDAAARLRQALAQGHELELTLRALVEVARKRGDAAEEARLLELLWRALPDPSPDLLADLGRAWLAQERLDEAQGLFERGLKQAPQHRPCLRGLAACAYKAGQRERARTLFQTLKEQDPQDAWAAQGLRNLEEARTRRVWLDSFDQAEVENSWKATADFGVGVRASGGRLLFQGAQQNDAEGITRLTRTVEGERVVKLEALLEVGGATTRAGLRWELAGGAGVVLFRDFDGRVRCSQLDDPRRGWSDPLDLGPWPAQGAHALAIDVTDPQKGELALLLDGKQLHTLRLNGFGAKQAGAVRLALYARGKGQGDRVEAAVDQVQVYVLRPEAEKAGQKH